MLKIKNIVIFLFFMFFIIPVYPKKFKKILAKVLYHTSPAPIVKAIKKKKDNIGVVEYGRLYRSGQLSGRKLSKIIKKYGIKTVINLRGKNLDRAWWQVEYKVTKSLNVKLCNIRMSANHYPSKKNLIKLLDAYDNAMGPILIHCRAGRDRTGEAAALWILSKMHGTKKQALQQLSFLKYQHVKVLHSQKTKLIKKWQDKEWVLNGGYEQDVLGLLPATAYAV